MRCWICSPLEHADVHVGAHHAVPELAHVHLVALREPAAGVEDLLRGLFFLPASF